MGKGDGKVLDLGGWMPDPERGVMVVGCGPSAHLRGGPGGNPGGPVGKRSPVDAKFLLGVNDCERHLGHPVDHLMVVETPQRMPGDRWKTVVGTGAKVFWGMGHKLGMWREAGLDHPDMREMFIECDVARWHEHFDHPTRIPMFMSSCVAAVGLAYRLGAKRIGIIGMDHVDHPELNGQHTFRIKEQMRVIWEELDGRGVDFRNCSPISEIDSIPLADLDFIADDVPF